ncbi:UDP-N-acetylmuramate dehydrogenase [Candidatus Colwellia aromaticivorans]|uniref:UDP-N-acetylmuramate dehydrogenase n=1 Tax=Candidatus Colwellia aromaticivorans TaxID=2267621 RepID=UPI000DF2835A|nr:UDP-N-acetylmuramate dehydrogenase [Candidatus Colwellia aromaticivorans]
MELSHQFSLQEYNSFNIKAVSPTIYFPRTVTDLEQLPKFVDNPFYILGDGSNTLFVDDHAPIIIKPDFKGISISETRDNYTVSVGAAENWHDLVCLCIEQGIYGLENLALIPGSVGAAPVQNIGAYGLELSHFCTQVKWFEFSSKAIKVLDNKDCQFSYRDSIFKQALHNKGIIIDVEFSFPKAWKANLSYAGLSDLGNNPSAKQVMDRVISLRQAKLPDPCKLPNAGSFFKNPIVNEQKLISLKNSYPKLPFYPQGKGLVKLAAGWLIEQAGLKGYREKGVGVHEHQALVLVNYASEQGEDIVTLAKYVQQQVLAKFDISISPEVRMITAKGEQNFVDLVVDLESK